MFVSDRVQFYPTVVFLTNNKLSLVALGNWGLVMTLGFGKLVRGIFLGPLREIEVEVRTLGLITTSTSQPAVQFFER